MTLLENTESLETFRAELETLGLDAPTLDMAPDALFSIRDSRGVAGRNALHTLPELRFDKALPLGKMADLRELGTLGQGGMGIVRLANQLALDREVAVKTTRSGVNERASASLLQEAYVTGYLEHPNIIPIYTLGRDSAGAPLIVMKRVEGTSWQDLLSKERAEHGAAMDLTRHVEILIQVCNALRFAHSRGVIHRDIKPDNVMIGHFDEVYVLDWGIAVSLREDRPLLPKLSECRGVCGTPGFMAPEMANESTGDQDEQSDVYLLGATLHAVLTGEPRHDGPSVLHVLFAAHCSKPYDYPASVPEELAVIATKACRAGKADRYNCVVELRDALQDYLEHRESIALSALADAKRVLLEGLLVDPTPDSSILHDTYGECRFGFYQALRMWAENPSARRGLQACLEAMAEYYLRQGNLEAALACIGEFSEPRPQLVERADALARQLEGDVEDFHRLKALERNLDLRTGSKSRTRMALAFGVIWTITGLHVAISDSLDLLTDLEKLRSNMIAGWRNVAIVGLAYVVFRKRIFANTANRRISITVMVTMLLAAFMRWSGWYFEAHVGFVYTVDVALYTIALVTVGLMSDRRIAWLSAGFAGAGVIGVLWPAALLYAHVAATAITLGGVAWIWRPSGPKPVQH